MNGCGDGVGGAALTPSSNWVHFALSRSGPVIRPISGFSCDVVVGVVATPVTQAV